MQKRAGEALWRSLAALDAYRRQSEGTPDTLTNAILLGTLLVPLGYDLKPPPVVFDTGGKPKKEPALSLGLLPLARRDVERLRQILSLQRRLTDLHLSPRARRTLMHRGPFHEALTWLEIHGHAPEALEHWRGFIEAAKTFVPGEQDADAAEGPRPRRRRRRRRRRPFRPAT
jgi:hypothetical protein